MGKVPDGWVDTTFGDELSLEYGKSLPSAQRTDGPVRVYGSAGEIGSHAQALVGGPGIVVGRKGSIGEVFWSDTDFWPIDTTYYVVTNGRLDLRFTYYGLAHRDLASLNRATGIPGLNRDDVAALHLPLPPLPEQRKIAAILSSVDDVIATTRKVIEQTERVKQGLLQTLMTGGIGHTRFKETEIGNIPEEWEVATVEECCEILDRHRVPLNSEERRERPGRIPYWGANGVVDYIDDYLFDEPLVLIAEDGGYFEEAATRPIAHLVDGKVWVNNHAHVLRVTQQVSRKWFYYWFVHRDITRFINSGTRSKLNQGDLRQLPVAVPSEDEGQEIVQVLESVDGILNGRRERIDTLRILKRGLLQDLLTGHVRVQPD